MTNTGSWVQIKPEHLIHSIMGGHGIICFNIRTFGKLFLNYFKNSAINLVLFWYIEILNELHDIPCSIFK